MDFPKLPSWLGLLCLTRGIRTAPGFLGRPGFAFCRKPQTCVVLSADDGKILATLPIGAGTDGGGFNPKTMEAFSSQRDGTLTIIKENSPTEYVVEETVQTKAGGKTCALDASTDHVIVITREAAPASPGAAPATAPAAGRGRQGGRGGAQILDVMFIGR